MCVSLKASYVSNVASACVALLPYDDRFEGVGTRAPTLDAGRLIPGR